MVQRLTNDMAHRLPKMVRKSPIVYRQPFMVHRSHFVNMLTEKAKTLGLNGNNFACL